MKNRKWQRVLSWILTLTMLLGTFDSNILAVNAMDDEVAAAEAGEDVDEPEVSDSLSACEVAVTSDWEAIAYKMGYTVSASEASSATNVVPKTIVLTNKTGADITDLSVKLADGVSFNLVNGGEDISLSDNEALEISVAPKEGLSVSGKNSADDVETFTDTLTISSNALTDDLVYDLVFKLGYDMEISTAVDGEAFTGNSITVSAGNAIPVIAVTAAGGCGEIDWEAVTGLPEGVSANKSGGVITVSGIPAISGTIVGSYDFALTAKDEEENTISRSFTINVEALSLDYTANGGTGEDLIKFGNKNKQSDNALTIVVSNPSDSEVKVNASIDSDKFFFDGDETADIAAGADAEFVILPKMNSVSDDTVTVTLSGNALVTKTFSYRLILDKDVLIITDPENGQLSDAIVGEDYAYTFRADGTVPKNVVKWSVSDDDADVLDEYGLALSESGVLSGTPKKVSDNVAFTVVVSGNEAVSSNKITFKIVSTDKAIVVSANGVVLEGKTASENLVDLGIVTTKTTDVSENTAKIVIKNTSGVDVGNVSVNLEKVEKKNVSGNYVDDTTGFFKFVGPTVFDGVSGNSIEFSIIPEEAEVIAAAAPDKAGDYRALVKVNSNKNLIAKSFYVSFTLQNTVSINGANKELEFKVNSPLSNVKFLAVSKNDTTNTDLTDVTWSWTASGNSTLPDGLTLNEDGTVTGTPAKVGEYNVSVNVVDNTTNDSDSRSFTIIISGLAEIQLTRGSMGSISQNIFAGVVKGDEITEDELDVAVKHVSGAAIKDINISLEDAEGFEGSAKHFELSTTSINKINAGGFGHFTIQPVDTSESGFFCAYVVVGNDTIEAKKFPVFFSVVDRLAINDVDASVLVAEVGQDYSLTVSAASVSCGDVSYTDDIEWSHAPAYTGFVNSKSISSDYTISGIPAVSGSYVVVVSANVAEDKYDGYDIVFAPAQTVSAEYIIEVNKSASVNVIGAEGKAGTYTTGESVPEVPGVSANVTAYTFASRAAGYDKNLETVSLTVKNSSKIQLTVSGNTTSTNFVVSNNELTLDAGAEDIIYVSPAKGLEAGTYTADLVISGNDVEDQIVALSFTVEEAVDSITLSMNNAAVSDDGITLDNVMRGEAASENVISIRNTGNVDVTIVSINEVKDAAGAEITGAPKLIIDNTGALKELTPDEETAFTVKTDTDVAGVFTAYFAVSYKVGETVKDPVVVSVNYIIYNDSVSVNVTPSQNTVSINSSTVSENYTGIYSKGFVITNGEAGVTGDVSDSLFDLRITLSGNDADKFILTADKVSENSAEYGADVIAKGSSYSFSIAAASGLPYGEYTAELTISASNMATITKTVTFTVTGRAGSYTIEVTSEGVSVEDAVNAQRIYNTLLAAGTVSANYLDTAIFTVSEDVIVTFDSVSRDNAYVVFLKDHTTDKPSISVNRDGRTASDNAVSDNKGNRYYYDTVTFELFDIVTFDAKGGKLEGGKDSISVNIANGSMLGTLPSVSRNNAAFKGWLNDDNIEVFATDIVKKDMKVVASWSIHKYPGSASGNVAGKIEWTWNGSASDNFAGTFVTLYCTDTNCPDKEGSAVKLSADITRSGKDASCEDGAAVVYTATALRDNNTYTDTRTVSDDKALGHIWKFDTDSVVWAEDYSSASISRNCVAAYHDPERDGAASVSVSTSNISFNGVEPGCTTSGNGVYTATFTNADDETISENIVVSVSVSEIKALGHDYKASWTWTDNGFAETPSVNVALVCARCGEAVSENLSVSVSQVSANATEKKYTASTTYEGVEYTSEEYTVYAHTKHNWTVSFNWVSISVNKADTEVTAEATCTVGGEKKILPVTLDNKKAGNRIEYTAKAVDPDGKEWTSSKYIDVNGKVNDGPAGTPVAEDGEILIVGLNEDGYEYTGSKIKPAFDVVDTATDTVLAKGVDYKVKFKNNKNPGEAIIEITGKGNYQGKSTFATFKINDTVAEMDADDLAGAVKKVKITGTKNFTYNGVAQYPSDVTVTLKDKTVITLKIDETGEITEKTGTDKDLVVTFSNNVNKGTATIAVAGDKNPKNCKKATYKIKAADLSAAKVADDLEGAYAVKGATPDELIVNWTNGEGDEVKLIAGQDFSVKYSDNKQAGTATIKLTGKGNFRNKLNGSFTVKPLEVEEIAAVKAYENIKAGKVKVTVLDGKGAALNQKKQLNVTVKDEEGKELGAKEKLIAGNTYTVVVTSKDSANVIIDETGITADVTIGKNISKAKINAKKLTKVYTGEAIELTEEDMGSVSVSYKGKELKYGEDFEIAGYTNNIKKGSMTVTIEGKGEYSGTKTFKVKITAKNLNAKVAE